MAIISINCASRGTPDGGPKDIDAPKIVNSSPENYSTNFKEKEIRIYFDEYVKVKDLQKQLIVSPPMDPEPTVTPLGSASEYIQITINDTLDDNTTYAFNFGRSIVDNNEENPYDYYRYVFSTGNYIDSLYVSGTILDAENRMPDSFVSVMLYEADSTYTDSLVFKQKPKYITNTLDSLTIFSIDNIKAGQYKLIALKEETPNNTYQQKTDKIGFTEGFITVPTDSFYTIKLFKETLDFNAKRPRQVAGQKIAFGFEGDYESMEIEILGDSLKDLEQRITKDPKADSLFYWYKPKIEMDSALFVIRNKVYRDTLTHKFRDLEKDSLVITPSVSSVLNFTEAYGIRGSIPFVKFDEQQISILDKDSLTVPFTTSFSEIDNTYNLSFDKKEADKYSITILPNAFEDFFGNVNDTLNFRASTKKFSDYGNLRLNIQGNVSYPMIVQIVNAKAEVYASSYLTEGSKVDFRNINPGKYFIRVVLDANENGKFDTGNFLKNLQPEKIIYFDYTYEARANFDEVVELSLK
jgi:uncharacterized protein (DUF2141 family)